MNGQKLKSTIVLFGENIQDLAEVLNITPQTLSNKIHSKYGACFTQDEIGIIKKHYNLNAEQVNEIFFS